MSEHDRPTDAAFDALRAPETPIEPDREFRASLRRRIHAAAGRPEPAASPTTQSPTAGGTAMSSTAMSSTATPSTGPRTYQRPDLHALTPYIMVDDARRAIEWYTDVLGATLDSDPVVMDDGRIGHAELRLGDSMLMLADEFPEMDLVSPNTRGGASVTLAVAVPDVDATFARAVEAGARSEREVADQFHGSRTGTIIDPFGHRWMISTWLGSQDDTRSAEGGDNPASTQAADLWNEVGYYVIGIEDLDRAMSFFGGLFGWQFSEPDTSPDGERTAHVESSKVPFGICEGDRPFVSPYFRVADLEAATARVRELGGEVLEVQQYASGGNATCVDDQGTRFELWQPGEGY
jgi:uncharacterized glyoxalase superfamily protein PhnB